MIVDMGGFAILFLIIIGLFLALPLIFWFIGYKKYGGKKNKRNWAKVLFWIFTSLFALLIIYIILNAIL